MGARLVYAKVVDRERFLMRGGEITPGLENGVLLREEPGEAGAFLVLRGWQEKHGTFTEQWEIQTPGGVRVYESLPREIHSPTEAHLERLEDEVVDLKLDDVGDYTVVFKIDEREVARVDFPVDLDGDGASQA